MKRIILSLVAFVFGGFAMAQDTSRTAPIRLLDTYLQLKEALVSGNAVNAGAAADHFVKVANTIDMKVISEDNIRILSADASRIASTQNLQQQRNAFANLSTNMAAVARNVKLSDTPVYLQYCPMKKATWLSAEKNIRNPYYNNAMLTCGQVQSTLGENQ
ncbi:MAG: DUF3347 domain-containing protein [Chitinophagaceae bacterium]|nr:MAG: DUF3347 domain-containing protein [Chitinophagaceae bacterium]